MQQAAEVVQQNVIEKVTLEEAVKLYGQPKLIDRQQAADAFNRRDKGLAFLILDDDALDALRAYEDEEYRKEFNIPKWTGDTPPTEDYQVMVPGWHSINVMDRYLFPNPLPKNIEIIGIDYGILEGEDGAD